MVYSFSVVVDVILSVHKTNGHDEQCLLHVLMPCLVLAGLMKSEWTRMSFKLRGLL